MARVFVPQETRPGEQRVAAVPETVKRLVAAGLDVDVERGAGDRARATRRGLRGRRRQAGAERERRPGASADLVLKVREPLVDRGRRSSRAGSSWSCLLDPYRNLPLVRRLAERGLTAFAMELVPRTTRAQAIDVALLAGLDRRLQGGAPRRRAARQVLSADDDRRRHGAAGARRGARRRRRRPAGDRHRAGGSARVVEVSDVRAAVKEQVESLGGRFIELPQMPTRGGAGGYAKEVDAGVPRPAARDPHRAAWRRPTS